MVPGSRSGTTFAGMTPSTPPPGLGAERRVGGQGNVAWWIRCGRRGDLPYGGGDGLTEVAQIPFNALREASSRVRAATSYVTAGAFPASGRWLAPKPCSDCPRCGPNGDFDAYWDFHLEREYQRTHRSRYAAGRVPVPVAPVKPALRRVN